MLKNKRISLHQSNKNKKKSQPSSNNPSFNCTQQIKLWTLQNTDLKNISKSIQIKNNKIQNEKPFAKKATNKSLKLSGSTKSNFKKISRGFKQQKLDINDRSKSKNLSSNKSRSVSKTKLKKSGLKMKTNPNSQENIICKLQKTIKNLILTGICKDEMSQLAIASSSEVFQPSQRKQISLTEVQEDYNLNQLKQFCSKAILVQKRDSLISFKSYDSFRQNRAALKIQRAWKRHRTNKIIQSYAICNEDQPQFKLHDLFNKNQFQQLELVRNTQQNTLTPIILSEDNSQRQKLSISLCDLCPKQYEQVLKVIKLEELQKWKEMILLINQAQSNDPPQLQKLLQKITEQSEINKKNLQQRAQNIIKNHKNKKNIVGKEESIYISKQDSLSQSYPLQRLSSNSKEDKYQYNHIKYVKCFDSDVFNYSNLTQPGNNQISQKKECKNTISKQKQQFLINELRLCKSKPFKLGHQSYNNSQLLSYEFLTKSLSQQFLKRAFSDKNLINQYQFTSQQVTKTQKSLNFDKITRQFLQNLHPSNTKITNENTEQELANEQYVKVYLSQQNVEIRNEQKDKNEVPSFFEIHQIQFDQQTEIKKQEQQINFYKIQSYNKQCQQLSTRGNGVSLLIFNILILETLKQVAISEKISQSFKKLYRELKQKRKIDKLNNILGFATGIKQIKHFLETILMFLKEYEPSVFKNLQVCTGPSTQEMLGFLHQQQGDQQFSSLSSNADSPHIMVISFRLFQEFWKIKEKTLIFQNNEYTRSLNKIFYRSLFDAFNQCLDCFRNFGQLGKTYPWKTKPSFHHNLSNHQINMNLQKAQEQMILLANMYCGLIIQKDEMSTIQQNQQLTEMHQDRLCRMLANDLLMNESKWIFYDDQEAEILVQLSAVIYRQIIMEIVEDLYLFDSL